MNLPNPYESKHYYLLGVIPLVLVFISLFLIPGIPKGVDLKGGTLITVQSATPVDAAALRADLAAFSSHVEIRQINTPTGSGIEIELENGERVENAEAQLSRLLDLDRQLSQAEIDAGAVAASNSNATLSASNPASIRVTQLEEQILKETRAYLASIESPRVAGNDAHDAVRTAQDAFAEFKQQNRARIVQAVQSAAPGASLSVREVGSALSKFFLSKAQEIVLYAFLFAAIVIFLIFRSIGPSLAVIFGAAANIIITGGVMSLLGIPLTLASIATLLMLIGFSLDTDVMLTIRVMQRKEGTPAQRTWNAMKTGALMNATTVGAFGALLAVALWLQIPTYQQIGSVAVIGGFIDFIATWGFNAALVLYFTKKQEHSTH